ncbi:pre-rRNA-processing protein pno1 [Lithohypha guttulata]|uniref:Pre-rRNA-processing protein PNO1 n=1 Tax=Lithohypha guttulata TaxID=1690604 RepID=A0AAN7TC78_9EURO|nr:pre-rRNA-processing protein pno1 [Lithohypha guttulata]KAK5090566.1 pre-rRNA-processing protein pno1 [Lithohypha guttulata]
MPAPTALQRKPEDLAQDVAIDSAPVPELNIPQEPLPTEIDISTEDQTQISTHTLQQDDQAQQEDTSMQIDSEGRPHFPPSTDTILSSPSSLAPTLATKIQSRKVPIPPHRLTPLKSAWPKIYPPLVEHLKLQVRMNVKSKAVELRTSRFTTTTDSLQKGEDFIRAFTLGFDVDDAIALLRLDDLYIETFEIKDVKTLNGEHLSRAIGRIAGKDGKTKFAIENTSKTRVVLADSKIHILGGFQNIRIAREAVVSLILGAPPGKVYGNLRTVAGRMKERF